MVVGGVGGVSILGEASSHKLLGVFPLQFIQDHGAPGGAQVKDSKLADAADGSLGSGQYTSAHSSVNHTLQRTINVALHTVRHAPCVHRLLSSAWCFANDWTVFLACDLRQTGTEQVLCM